MALSKIDGTNLIAPTIPVASGGTGSATLAGAGLANTPSFQATVNGAQTISTGTATKIEFDTENFDTNSKYDVSTYRFTPGTAGKYLIHARVGYADASSDDKAQESRIYKNGSLVLKGRRRTVGATGRDATVTCVGIVDLGASDYVEAFAYHNNGTNLDTLNSTTELIFEGYKLIGV